jgi:hypothetical protein
MINEKDLNQDDFNLEAAKIINSTAQNLLKTVEMMMDLKKRVEFLESLLLLEKD